MVELYLCRHGETEWTLSDQHTSRTDIDLTQNGIAQAALLRKQMEGIQFEVVFASPMKRAIQTAKGFNPKIDPLLQEWDYGDYEGLKSADIHKENPNWNLFTQGAPNGESPQLVGKRADAFLKKISQYEGKVAIFSHGHFLRVLAARYLGLEAEMGRIFLLSVASLGILKNDRGQNGIHLWNQTHY